MSALPKIRIGLLLLVAGALLGPCAHAAGLSGDYDPSDSGLISETTFRAMMQRTDSARGIGDWDTKLWRKLFRGSSALRIDEIDRIIAAISRRDPSGPDALLLTGLRQKLLAQRATAFAWLTGQAARGELTKAQALVLGHFCVYASPSELRTLLALLDRVYSPAFPEGGQFAVHIILRVALGQKVLTHENYENDFPAVKPLLQKMAASLDDLDRTQGRNMLAYLSQPVR